jgi:hypothetical protein
MATTENVHPLRPLADADALDWLRAQPEGRTIMSAAELARRWGWPRYKVGRRLQAWSSAGHVVRKGRGGHGPNRSAAATRCRCPMRR